MQTYRLQETSQEAQEEEDPVIPEIDASVEIQPGARIAVVSKSTSGSYWSLVRQGMEQAVEDVNEAYGFGKDEQITMTFEGASDEKDVSSQVNTLDAVIAENPDVLCISASDTNSLRHSLNPQRERNPGCGI